MFSLLNGELLARAQTKHHDASITSPQEKGSRLMHNRFSCVLKGVRPAQISGRCEDTKASLQTTLEAAPQLGHRSSTFITFVTAEHRLHALF